MADITLQDVVSNLKIAAEAATDPDGYYFPKIIASTTRDEAIKWLNTWKPVKVLNLRLNDKVSEMGTVEVIYQQKLAEINTRFAGQQQTTKKDGIIVAGIAIGVLVLIYYVWSKGKSKS